MYCLHARMQGEAASSSVFCRRLVLRLAQFTHTNGVLTCSRIFLCRVGTCVCVAPVPLSYENHQDVPNMSLSCLPFVCVGRWVGGWVFLLVCPSVRLGLCVFGTSLMSGAAATCEGQKLFMAKFNFSPSDTSRGEAPAACSTTALRTAAVPKEAPVPAESMSRIAPAAGGAGPRFTYQYLSIVTNNFEKRLGGGGCGSVFQGVLASGTVLL